MTDGALWREAVMMRQGMRFSVTSDVILLLLLLLVVVQDGGIVFSQQGCIKLFWGIFGVSVKPLIEYQRIVFELMLSVRSDTYMTGSIIL